MGISSVRCVLRFCALCRLAGVDSSVSFASRELVSFALACLDIINTRKLRRQTTQPAHMLAILSGVVKYQNTIFVVRYIWDLGSQIHTGPFISHSVSSNKRIVPTPSKRNQYQHPFAPGVKEQVTVKTLTLITDTSCPHRSEQRQQVHEVVAVLFITASVPSVRARESSHGVKADQARRS